FEMPPPVAVTDDQLADLFQATHSNAEFDAWLAIARQLDRFANRLSQGLPFFRIKPKVTLTETQVSKIEKLLRPNAKAVAKIPNRTDGEIECEGQIDIQLVDGEFEVITTGDVLVKAKLTRDAPPIK